MLPNQAQDDGERVRRIAWRGWTQSAGLMACLAVLVSCTSQSPGNPILSSATLSAASSASPSRSTDPWLSYAAISRAVSFSASDGVKLAGRLFGAGHTAVVLAHMGNPGDNQTDWFPLAAAFSKDGFTVLTFDRRGVCFPGIAGLLQRKSRIPTCVEGRARAVSYLEARGSHQIFIGGASIGAMATLQAAESLRNRVAGVIWLAGLRDASGYRFLRTDVSAVAAPKLFMSATDDPYGAADDARTLY